MTDYPIPPRITKYQAWLHDKSQGQREEIAQDLISINYWAMIDERGQAAGVQQDQDTSWLDRYPTTGETRH